MGIFSKFSAKKQVAERQQQMEAFVKGLRERNDMDMAYTLLLVTHVRHAVKAQGYDMLMTNMQYELNQQACAVLGQLINEYRAEQKAPLMYACMVWVYTMNAAVAMDMRSLGRQMWRELRRGEPLLKENMERAQKLIGREPDYAGHDQWPHGF